MSILPAMQWQPIPWWRCLSSLLPGTAWVSSHIHYIQRCLSLILDCKLAIGVLWGGGSVWSSDGLALYSERLGPTPGLSGTWLGDGRMEGWRNGWMDEWMAEWMDGWVCGWMGGWLGWQKERVTECISFWTPGSTADSSYQLKSNKIMKKMNNL